MTKQITLKLNEKLFGPLIETLMKRSDGIIRSNSELAGMSIYYMYQMNFDRLPELNNKTRAEFLLEKRGYSGDTDGLLLWLREFRTFLKKKGL